MGFLSAIKGAAGGAAHAGYGTIGGLAGGLAGKVRRSVPAAMPSAPPVASTTRGASDAHASEMGLAKRRKKKVGMGASSAGYGTIGSLLGQMRR